MGTLCIYTKKAKIVVYDDTKAPTVERSHSIVS